MGPAAELAAACACAIALCACGSKSGLPERVGPPCTTDADCDDGVTCNGPEHCVDAVCESSAWLTCDDGDPCTADRCDEPAGCSHRDLRVDADHDGYDLKVAIDCGDDCDDARADVHPGATEICNGVDDDCNGLVDEGARFAPASGVVPVAASPAMQAAGLEWNASTHTWSALYLDHTALVLRPLAPDGTPAGDAVELVPDAADVFDADIAGDGRRNLVAWTDRADATDRVRTALVDPTGARLREDGSPSTGRSETRVHVVRGAGQYALAWVANDGDVAPGDAILAFVDDDGRPIGEPTQLTSSRDVFTVALTTTASGLAVVSASQEGATSSLVLSTLDAWGGAQRDTTLASGLTRTGEPSLASVGGGTTLVFYTSATGPSSSDVDVVRSGTATATRLVAGSPEATVRQVLSLGDAVLVVYAETSSGRRRLRLATVDATATVVSDVPLPSDGNDDFAPVVARGDGDVGLLFTDVSDDSFGVAFERLACTIPP